MTLECLGHSFSLFFFTRFCSGLRYTLVIPNLLSYSSSANDTKLIHYGSETGKCNWERGISSSPSLSLEGSGS